MACVTSTMELLSGVASAATGRECGVCRSSHAGWDRQGGALLAVGVVGSVALAEGGGAGVLGQTRSVD